MRQTITITPKDEVRVDDDWGTPVGIVIGDLHINLIGSKARGAVIAAIQDMERDLADHEARRDGRPTEAEILSDCGPLYAGLEDEVV